MKFAIFFSRLMCICVVGLTSVVGASPLDTIPPPITDFFIPVNQRAVEPVRNPGDFIGRVFAPKPEDWKTRSEAQPITGVTVTIVSGPRSGESITTDQSGYYLFPNVDRDALHLLVEKEHFEPKEVIVSRFHPTKLASGAMLNYHEDVQQHPGNILIGQQWPDEVRFILEETLVVHDLLYVEGGRPPKGADIGAFYSLGVIVLYSHQYADWKDEVGLLGTFAHEIAHAHQHATVSVDGSAWEIHGWGNTPEGRAYEEAQRKDWEQVGKSPLDNTYGNREGKGGVALTETAAETCAHYWSVDRWGGRTAYGFLEVEAPHRYKWAEKWVPISIAVRPPPKVVSIPDPNLAKAVRNALGLGTNAPITQQWMQGLTELDARKSQIKNLTGLEHATRLRVLELRENQIRDIRPLTNLKNLKELMLDDNNVSDITPLTNMTQLTWLIIGRNPISDFTPIKNLTELRGLSFWGNNVSNASLFAGLTKLTNLWLGLNKISNITPLADLVNLKVLSLHDNQIRDVSPLTGLVNLETLHLKNNPIQNASVLASLTKLRDVDIEIPPPSPVVQVDAFVSIPDPNLATALREALGLDGNDSISDLALQSLTELDARERQIKDLTGLEHATRLRLLELRENQIRDIRPLTNLKNLKELMLDDNNVSDITPLTNMTQLTWLIIGRNPISDFTPIKNLTELRGLSFWGNNVSNASLFAGLTKLTNLWLGLNKISNITPLADLVNLKVLSLHDNQIRDVSPLTGLVNLETLHLKNNPIQNASVLASLTKLRDVDIEIPPPSPVVRVDASERPPMYWVNTDDGTLHRLIGDNVENLLPSVRNATGLAVDITNNKVYWTEKTSDRTGKIRRANLDGSNPERVKDLTSAPLYIAVDTANGKLYLINAWNKIQRMNLDGTVFQPNLVTGLQAPKGLAVDAAGGKMYWSEQTGQRTGKMSRANLDGSEVEVIKTLTSVPQGIALDAAGNTVYITNTYGKIQRMNLDGSHYQPNLITGLTAPLNVAVDAVDGKVYWMERGSLRRADLNGENVVDVVTGLGTSAGLVLGTMPMDVGAPAAPAAVASLSRKNALLANYPNPFNPETWIPYQLSKPAEVTLHIYAVNGALIRTLALGYQPAGMYQNKSRAAYWDGKNALGEPVASGMYFYTLTAADFTATRKMLIRK